MELEKKTSIKKILLVGLSILFFTSILTFWFIQKVVDQRTFTPSDQNFKFCPELKQKGFTVQENVVKDQTLRYYMMKSEGSKGTLIFYHGSGRSACEYREILSTLEGLPLDIIILR